MDKVTAYIEALKAATAAVEVCLALLPDDAWGDDAEDCQLDERAALQEVRNQLADRSIPFGKPRR